MNEVTRAVFICGYYVPAARATGLTACEVKEKCLLGSSLLRVALTVVATAMAISATAGTS